MSVVASDQTHRIRLSFNAGMLKFSVSTPDLGEAQDELSIRYDGDPLDIGFNISYLLDVLNHVDSPTVSVAMGDSNSSALVQMPGHDDFKYVVMPMRI